MDQQDSKIDVYFAQLVLSFQAAAMQAMGKVVSPLTGKIERDLLLARNYIDMLAMMETKTTGNLTSEERNLLARALYELRLNYVDESHKDTEAKAADAEPGATTESGNGTKTDSTSTDSEPPK